MEQLKEKSQNGLKDTTITDSLKAVILVGNYDFGRCPLASRLNRAFWPVVDKPALQRLIEQLQKQGVKRIVISCSGRVWETQKYLSISEGTEINFAQDTLPRGPAGCLRDAIDPEKDKDILLLSANVIALPPIKEMLKVHLEKDAVMTVFLNAGEESKFETNAHMYLCRAEVAKYIPQKGYYDLQEGLTPALVKAGRKIQGAFLDQQIRTYRSWYEYIEGIKKSLLENAFDTESSYQLLDKYENVRAGPNVRIDESVRFVGPVLVGPNTFIGPNTAIFGPTVIGPDVNISSNVIIEESVIWQGASLGQNSRIRNSLIDYKKAIGANKGVLERLAVTPVSKFGKTVNWMKQHIIKSSILQNTRDTKVLPDKKTLTLSELLNNKSFSIIGPLGIIIAFAALIYSYWHPTLKSLVSIWLESDEYSSGLLVAPMALYVIWTRRESFLNCRIKPHWLGLCLLAASQGLRLFGLYFMLGSVERASFVLSIGSLVFLVFGWQFFKKVIPVFLFLFLMLPLPNSVERLVMVPLQQWATLSSVFCLEMLGFEVIHYGNIIDINGTLVAVAEACNGLRMLTAFFVVSGLVTLLINGKLWEKILILISAVPIALICNTIRLTITAIALVYLEGPQWEKVFHDFGGIAMMPLAVAMIFLELWFLSKLIVEPKQTNEDII